MSPRLSHTTYETAYARFTPSDSEQRLRPLYYRGCWHRVSRLFLLWYYLFNLLPHDRGLQSEDLHSPTRRRTIRVSPIVNDSRLLPPVGVWTVSQFQCGRTSSQTGYLGEPLPHQLTNRTRAHPQAHCCFNLAILCGINPSFPGLSHSWGQVTHVLLTRAPLENY